VSEPSTGGGAAAGQDRHARGSGRPAGGLQLDFEVPLGVRPLSIRMDTESRAVAVVGPSGAGKSTLLRVLAGVERRARGTVSVHGETWLRSADGVHVPPWARGVGWVPQEVSLFPHLSVRENLGYAAAARGREEEVASLLEVADLLDRRPRWLSGGERQRVALGRALLAAPRLLLLDEPFSALDRPLRAKVAGLVRKWVTERGIPLVLVSHDEEDTRILADERWHLADGRLRLDGADGASGESRGASASPPEVS
jgi:molybdate transport system ATP-binding protein